ncbi:MAG: hypothetical protein KAV87_58360 [Desulfobacteraceae bacterium]|nr:hypothetical protein [Desulfobacteraceae bacterium]
MKANTRCLCCKNKIPKELPRHCPMGDHDFQGKGWEGMDAHWRKNHENIMTYEKFRESLCNDHGIRRRGIIKKRIG